VEVDLTGKELPNAPHWTFSFGAQYTWDIGGGWEGTIRGDYYKSDGFVLADLQFRADALEGWENFNATFTTGQLRIGLVG
jgi:iron complex outermembrane receptor protein